MLYKRPMFKMGGSPTGIETLEPRKKFEFGTSRFSFLEPGLQRELRIENELKNRPKIGTRTLSARQNIPTGGLRKGNIGSRFLTQTRNLPSLIGQGIRGIGLNLPTAYATAVPATIGGLMYLNRPKTDEALKFMKSAP